MPVYYLGYNDLDFETSDGKKIDGLKVFWYFDSTSSNYFGYEVGSYFIPRNNIDLIKMIREITPGSKCILTMYYNGKKPVFVSLIEEN